MSSDPPRGASSGAPLERSLTEQLSFGHRVIDKAAEGICVCHFRPGLPELEFTIWNERMLELTGYTMAEINTRGWQTLIPDPGIRARAAERIGRLRSGDSLDVEEWTVTRADGVERVLQLSVSALSTQSGEAHFTGLLQDVTERRERQAELERLKDFHAELVNATSEGIGA